MAERKLRSHEWFGKADKDGFLHRSWMKNQGLPGDLFDGRPVIGICNTWSELTPCNAHFRELAEKVKRGVYEAGGIAGGVPGHVARREQPQADGDALPQPRQHGRGGIDPRQPHRWRRAAHGLRQDDAGAPHGGCKLRPADHRSFGRADAHRALPRAARSAPAPTCSSSPRSSAPAACLPPTSLTPNPVCRAAPATA